VMVFAGLRGAVAYALSQQLKTPLDGRDQSVQVIQSTTLAVIIFTTFCLGGTTSPLLSAMKMKASGGKRGE
jgi:NhaP-type Na+/H+ or K+/H+ antiporter